MSNTSTGQFEYKYQASPPLLKHPLKIHSTIGAFQLSTLFILLQVTMKFHPAILATTLALFLQSTTAIKCVPEHAARKAPCTIGDWGCNGGNLVVCYQGSFT